MAFLRCTKNPQGLKMFIQSVAGRKAMEQVFIQYQEHRHKTLVPPNHVKLVEQITQ
jgi:hypothetical protein